MYMMYMHMYSTLQHHPTDEAAAAAAARTVLHVEILASIQGAMHCCRPSFLELNCSTHSSYPPSKMRASSHLKSGGLL